MKKMLLLTIALVLVAAGVASAAGSIVGTAHDMRTYFNAGAGITTQVCVYCHTPHMPAGRTQDPLWNHTMSTQGSYNVYGSSTMNAAPTAMQGSDGSVGSLCMSCHDGTVAVNTLWKQPTDGAVGSTRNALGNTILNGSSQIATNAGGYLGTDLSNDHPVNFTYDAALVGQDKGIQPVATVVAAGLPLFTGSSMQCATCHNVHDNTNVPFLRINNAASALCTTCHIK
jgi:predicted CXXCH cytochrome family protein